MPSGATSRLRRSPWRRACPLCPDTIGYPPWSSRAEQPDCGTGEGLHALGDPEIVSHLAGTRRLQGGELAVELAGGHEMAFTPRHSGPEQCGCAGQMHESHVGAASALSPSARAHCAASAISSSRNAPRMYGNGMADP